MREGIKSSLLPLLLLQLSEFSLHICGSAPWLSPGVLRSCPAGCGSLGCSLESRVRRPCVWQAGAGWPGRTTWPDVVCAHQHQTGFRHFVETTSSRGCACKGDVSLLCCLRSSKPHDGEVKSFIFFPPLAVSSGAWIFPTGQWLWRRMRGARGVCWQIQNGEF